MELTGSLFDRSVGRPRSWHTTLLIALALYGAAFLVGWRGYSITELFADGHWRGVLISPTIILYVLLIAPKLSEMEDEVIDAVLPLAELDDQPSAALASESASMSPRQEMGAIAVGALGGAIIAGASVGPSLDWVTVYTLILTPAVLGLLSWTVYASVVSVRVTAGLLEQQLRVNLLDLSPFKIVGRSSLYLALAFVGGVTIALIFSAPEPAVLGAWEFWLVNGPMFMMPVVIFFWNMYPTHRIIASAKADELKELRRQMRSLSLRLLEGIEKAEGTPQVSAEMQALIAYEQRLEQVQTWPYDVTTLRSLVVSVLIPGVTVVAQVAVRRLVGW